MRDQTVETFRSGSVMTLRIDTDGEPERIVRMIDYPDVRQVYNYDCGAAAMRTMLNFYGFDVREDKVMEIAGTNEDGTNPSGLAKVGAVYGLQNKVGRATPEGLRGMIDDGMPAMILLQAWSDSSIADWSGWEDGHWVVCVGYDDRSRFYFEDPSSPLRTWMTEDELEERWHSVGEGEERTDHFVMIFFGKPVRFRATNFVHMD